MRKLFSVKLFSVMMTLLLVLGNVLASGHPASIQTVSAYVAPPDSPTPTPSPSPPAWTSITPEWAAQIATDHVTREAEAGVIPEWKESTIGELVEHYDLDGSLSAYVFSVFKEGEDVGYIVVSSKPMDNPVVEFSEGGARYKTGAVHCEAIAEEEGLIINKTKPLYLGPLSYYYEVFEDESYRPTGSRRIIEMGSNRIVTLNEQGQSCSVSVPTSETNANQTLSSNAAPTLAPSQVASMSPMSYGYVSGVPSNCDRNWTSGGCYLGCGPCAGGAVTEYWADHGFPNLVPVDDWTMLWRLHSDYMYTYCNGWTYIPPSPHLGKAVSNYAQDQGYSGFSTSHTNCGGSDWTCYSRFVDEIDNQRPGILWFGNRIWDGDFCTGHFVAGVGYSDSYLIVYDNAWRVGDDTYIQYGVNYTSMWVDTVSGSSSPPPPPPSTDSATFVSDITLPDDGPPVSPNQALHKVWRVRNSGTSTWGSGYQLVFTGGDQMGAPSAVNVPGTVNPSDAVNLAVDMTAPSNPGHYVGHWRLRNPQGVYFGDELRVEVTVPDGSVPGGDIELTCLDCPAAVAPGQTFRPTIRAKVNSGQLLGVNLRGDMLRHKAGDRFGAYEFIAVEGNDVVNPGQTYDFTFYENDPLTAPNEEGDYETTWQVWRNGNWDGDEITIRFNVQQSGGTNYPPNPPTLTGPGDWAIFQGTPVVLTAQHNGDPDDDAVTGYYFDLMGSNPTNSGWIGSNTWNPQGLPYSNYEWRAKVRDSRGAESGWSPQTWHFNVLNNNAEIYEFYSTTCRDAWGGPEKICFCAKTNAGTLQLQVNTATDGSDRGEWRIINELGVPEYRCVDDSDRPPNTNNLEWETGTHRARLYARREGGWANAAYRDITFSLPAQRRPDDPAKLLPANDAHVNSMTVRFDWRDTLRTDDYHLEVSTDPNYGTKLVDQHLGVGVSEYTHTFDSDYETLYWRVKATGPYGTNGGEGSGSRFHIDLEAPGSAVTALPTVTMDTAFPVRWGGSDARSGLRWYDVQFRDGERDAWGIWMAQTTLTSALFRGEPGHAYYFRCRAMDQVGNWEEYPVGDGGDTHTLVDPTAAPQEAWWDAAYSFNRNIVVLNNDGHTMLAHYPVHLHFDGSTTPTAEEVYNASQSAVKGDDFRIVYNSTTELDRRVQDFSPTEINIWFPLLANLGGHHSSEGDYQLYYGNPSAINPPADLNAIFLPTADEHTVALWHFQEGSGNTVFDTSGNNHNGTFYSADWVAGFLGTAGKFNGSSAYVDAGSSNDFNLATGPMTIEAWIYLTGNTGNYPHVVSKWGPGDGSYFLRITGGRNPQLSIRSGGDVAAGTSLELNRWYHVAATYDGINTMRIFINGGQAASKTNAKDGLSTTRRLFVGWAEEGADGGHFPGYIQHVRISNVDRGDFPYARVVEIPAVEVGASISQPGSGTPNLAMRSLTTYPSASGGLIVQAVLRNEGDASTTNGFYTDLYADHLPTGAGYYTGSVRFWIASPIEAEAVVTLTTVLTDVTSAGGLSAADLGSLGETSVTLYAQADSSGVVSETDNLDNISTGVDVCIASADGYEGDDILADAQPIVLGETQHHNFDSLSDQDWIKFTAQGGVTYTIQTSDLGPAADTYLYLYDTDGTTLLAANDDYGGSLASQIEWSPPITDTYYVLVKHWNPNVGGCGTGYDLTLAKALTNRVYLPLVLRNSAPSASTLWPGNALSLNGTDGYISIADNDSLDGFSGITVEAWVNTNDSSGSKTIVSKYRHNSGGDWVNNHLGCFRPWK